MGHAARRRLAVLVPWVALILVSLVALRMIGRTRPSEATPSQAAVPATEPTTLPAGTTGPAAAPPQAADVPAVTALEDALDAALEDLAAARRTAASAATARGAAERRAESLAAERDLLRVRVAQLEARPAETSDEDAQVLVEQENAALRAQVEALRTELAARPEGGAGEGGEEAAAGAVVETLLLADATPADVRAAGRAAVADVDVLRRLLAEAPVSVADEALALAAPALDADARAELGAALGDALDAGPGPRLALVLRAAARLAAPGLAARLAGYLASDDPALRAAAGHALARAPDLAEVRDVVSARIAALLLDESRDVRMAGYLLAEALLGEPVAYRPDAGEAERRAATEVVLDRLQHP